MTTLMTRKEITSGFSALVRKQRDFYNGQDAAAKAFERGLTVELNALCRAELRLETATKKAVNVKKPEKAAANNPDKVVGTIITDSDSHHPLTAAQKALLLQCVTGKTGSLEANSDSAHRIVGLAPCPSVPTAYRDDADETFTVRFFGRKTEMRFIVGEDSLSWTTGTIANTPYVPETVAA